MTLVSRQGCHLCEQAEAWLAGTGHPWVRLDVDVDVDPVDPCVSGALPLSRAELSEMVPVLLVDGRVLGWGRLDPGTDGVRLERVLGQKPGDWKPW